MEGCEYSGYGSAGSSLGVAVRWCGLAERRCCVAEVIHTGTAPSPHFSQCSHFHLRPVITPLRRIASQPIPAPPPTFASSVRERLVTVTPRSSFEPCEHVVSEAERVIRSGKIPIMRPLLHCQQLVLLSTPTMLPYRIALHTFRIRQPHFR